MSEEEAGENVAERIGLESGSSGSSGSSGVSDESEAGNSNVAWLRARSKNKDPAAYKSHPLNFDGTESTGQILKGIEGLLGSLDYAVVDILIGVIRKLWEYWDTQEGQDQEQHGGREYET